MSEKQKNAKSFPQVFYGLHMSEGVAEYNPPEGEMYRILLEEPTLKQMDKTFTGKPVVVGHIEEIDLENIENQADGYVIQSFYNPPDGRHWCKFLVISDKAKQAIQDGWQLSNAYDPLELGDYGQWHSVEYDRQVLSGEYHHLAIVQYPRYEESTIMTPEEFRQYNKDKQWELEQVANSKEDNKTKTQTKTKKGELGMLNFFKKERMENNQDLENMAVQLPKSKREVDITTLVNEADEREQNKDEPRVVDMKDKVNMGDEYGEVKVEDLANAYKQMKKSKKNEEEEEEEENKKNGEEEEEEEEKENKKNEKEKPSPSKQTPEKEQPNSEFETLANAKETAEPPSNHTPAVDLGGDMAERGRQRYGSK